MSRLRTAIAVACLAAATAAVAPAAATAAPSTDGVSAASCSLRAKENVYLRERPTSDSKGLAYIVKGRVISGPCDQTSGQRLGDCQPGTLTDNQWFRMRADGHIGWVFGRCVTGV